MSPLILTLIFLGSLLIVIGVLYWQSHRIRSGKVSINPGRIPFDAQTPFSVRDILILVLYIIKHTIQFIIIQFSKLYFFLERKIRSLPYHKNTKISRILAKIKIPPVPPQAKVFMKRTIEETRQKIDRVKRDLTELEETMEKRVD